jgi:putative endonuclease
MIEGRPWHLYMVRCSDGSLYTGIARDPEERVRVHNQGQGAEYAARRRPVVLVYSERHASQSAARWRELQVKAWRAEKKERLVRAFPSASSGQAIPVAGSTVQGQETRSCPTNRPCSRPSARLHLE